MNVFTEKLEEEIDTHIFRVFLGTSNETLESEVTRLESEDDDELNGEENQAEPRLSVGTIVHRNGKTYIQIDD